MRNLKFIIIIFLLITKATAQTSNSFEENCIIIDINNDRIADTIVHEKVSNKFIFKYKINGKLIVREISFFKNYGNGITLMHFSVKNNILIFKMSYAPRLLDSDTLKFEYNKLKDDWILRSILIHRFSPIDPELVTRDCLLTMKSKITLTNSIYDDIEENITKTSKVYILKKTCKNIIGENYK